MRGKLLKAIAIGLAVLFTPAVSMAASKGKRAETPAVTRGSLDLRSNNRVVHIKGGIRSRMADKIVQQINTLSDASTTEPIYYLIDTFGGSLLAGNKIIRAMNGSKAPGICVIEQAAYSMGALILAQCKTAMIYRDGSVLFHEGYLGVEARVSEVFTYIEFEKKEFDRLNEQTAKALKMDLKTYLAKQKDEFWLTAEETVQAGLATQVLDKLDYKVPPEEKLSIFDLFFSDEYNSKSDGFFDLTYYPKGRANPYDPAKKFRVNEDKSNCKEELSQ